MSTTYPIDRVLTDADHLAKCASRLLNAQISFAIARKRFDDTETATAADELIAQEQVLAEYMHAVRVAIHEYEKRVMRYRDSARSQSTRAADEAAAWTKDAENWGKALNEAGWTFIEACPEKSALLFNSCKPALRLAILKYAELVGQAVPAVPDGEAVGQCPNCLGTTKPSQLDPDWLGRCECKEALQVDAAPPQSATEYDTMRLAEMVLSDCGCSTAISDRLQRRVAGRIQAHINALLAAQPAQAVPDVDTILKAAESSGLWETRQGVGCAFGGINDLVRFVEALAAAPKEPTCKS